MDNNLKYKCLHFWNERYKHEDHFEWFGEYAKFKSVLDKKLNHSDKILTLGMIFDLFLIHINSYLKFIYLRMW